jgi:hypothetical protein
MNTLHPIFQQALAPFVQPRKPRKTTETFEYCLAGVDLVCEMDYERQSGDGWNEPIEGPNAYLSEAFCGNTDIAELLSDKQREEIETAYLEQEPDYDCPEPDFAPDETSFG